MKRRARELGSQAGSRSEFGRREVLTSRIYYAKHRHLILQTIFRLRLSLTVSERCAARRAFLKPREWRRRIALHKLLSNKSSTSGVPNKYSRCGYLIWGPTRADTREMDAIFCLEGRWGTLLCVIGWGGKLRVRCRYDTRLLCVGAVGFWAVVSCCWDVQPLLRVGRSGILLCVIDRDDL